MKTVIGYMACGFLALQITAASALSPCDPAAVDKIKASLSSKGYTVEDVIMRLYDVEKAAHVYEADVLKDGKKQELWLDAELNIVSVIDE